MSCCTSLSCCAVCARLPKNRPIASDQRRSRACSGSGIPMMAAITARGSGRARSAMTSMAPRSDARFEQTIDVLLHTVFPAIDGRFREAPVRQTSQPRVCRRIHEREHPPHRVEQRTKMFDPKLRQPLGRRKALRAESRVVQPRRDVGVARQDPGMGLRAPVDRVRFPEVARQRVGIGERVWRQKHSGRLVSHEVSRPQPSRRTGRMPVPAVGSQEVAWPVTA